ncbi:acyltransferase family protein [Clostridium fessum]|uniref:acyltransferase family protein n=1 Tax=Clostridium fessum TaxID=2126740 RepID=UPI0022E16993|nr:acyltransferase [Clostridium fessum]
MKNQEVVEHYPRLDFLKFIAAVLVITIHTQLFCDINEWIYCYYGKIITSCAVPFFFVLSGYFYGKEYQQGMLSRYKCGRLIKKYLKMYLLWGGVYAILLTIRKIGSGNVPFNVLRNQIVDFVIGSPGNVMWYIGVMLFISLLLKLIIVFDKNIHKAMAVWFVISVLLFVFSVLWDYVPTQTILGKAKTIYDSVITSERIALFRFHYFVLGFLFGMNPDQKIKCIKMRFGMIVLTFAIVSDLVKLQVVSEVLWAVWCGFVSIFLMKVGCEGKKHMAYDSFQYGKMSTPIYFIHYLTIFAFEMLSHFLYQNFGNLVETLICILATLLISAIVCKLPKLYKFLF